MMELGLKLISGSENPGQFDTTVLDKYFELHLKHTTPMKATPYFSGNRGGEPTACVYLAELKIDLQS